MCAFKKTYPKNKTVIFSWIFSYIVIVSIPILVSTCLLLHALKYMQKENQKICQAELNTIASTLDGYFEEMRHIALEFSMNPQLLPITHDRTFSAEDHYTLYELQTELQHYKITNSNIHRIGLLFMEQDMILTNSTNDILSDAVKNLLGNTLLSSLKFHTFQNNFYYTEELETFLYLLSLPLSADTPSNCYIFLTLNPSIWEEIQSNQQTNSFSVSFENTSGGLMSTSDLNSNNELILNTTSKIPNISYTLVFRNSNTLEHIQAIQFVMIFFGILCIVLSIFLAVYFTRKNYRPLANLIQKFFAVSPKKNTNEYQLLEKHITAIQKERLSLQNELLKKHEILDDLYIRKLLKNTYTPNELTIIQNLPLWSASTHEREKSVALVSIATSYSSEKPGFVRFIIHNILQDLISPDLRWQFVDFDDTFVLLIHGPHSLLQQTCNVITTQMPPLLTSFNIRIHFGFSIGHTEIPLVHRLYKESQEALEYSQLYNLSFTYYENNISKQNEQAKSTRNFVHIQHKFYNSVITQNFDTSLQLLPELFENFFPTGTSASILRLNIYSLVNLYQSSLMELSEKNVSFHTLIDPQITSLLNCVSLDSLKNKLILCLQALCDFTTTQTEDQKSRLIEEIKEYIEIHYSDTDLSAGSIADYFQIPQSTLSKLFKKSTSCGMLDYIHKIRIQQAKTLLQTQNYTVNEIASMVGYLSASSFIRIFKKYEGISPGSFL